MIRSVHTLLICIAALALAHTSAAQMHTDPDGSTPIASTDHPICLPYVEEWNAAAESSNLGLMKELLNNVPPICRSLLEQAQTQIQSVQNILLSASDQIGTSESITRLSQCEICPEMVSIPAGEFEMGSSLDEALRGTDEGPKRTVRVKEFMVSKTEITFEDWDKCVDQGACDGYRPSDEYWGRGSYPVLNVNWFDAQNYATWLSQKSGLNFRLLSEAEWEYMARASTTTPFYTGETIDPELANFDTSLSYNGSSRKVPRNQPVPVGEFPSNEFGVFDTLGNVLEWTEDCATEDYLGALDTAEPNLIGDCESRMLRGGSWASAPDEIRSAKRFSYPAVTRTSRIGFRLALGLNADRQDALEDERDIPPID